MQKNILIIEESATIRNILEQVLRQAGFVIVSAHNGKEGLDLYLSLQPDIVIMNIEMSYLDGLAVCQKIRKEEKQKNRDKNGIPVLLLSSNDNLDIRLKAYQAGGTDFIVKPFAPQLILEKIQNLLLPQPPLVNSKILVIEDSAPMRQIITTMLRESGAEVWEAENGKQGFGYLEHLQNELDLIILDLVLPDVLGSTICRMIRNEFKLYDLPILVLTVLNDKSNIVELFHAGATDYITKPFIEEELIARIHVQVANSLARKKLRKSIEMKSDFLSMANHEIRTPMNGLMGMLDLLMLTPLSDQQKEYVDIINNSSANMLSVLDDILDISKIQNDILSITQKRFDLHGMLKQILTVSKYKTPQEVAVKLILSDSVPQYVISDENRLRQILNNLIFNAIKFTSKGNIVIDVDANIYDPDKITLKFKISDTGIGIAKENLNKIFEKFTQAHNEISQHYGGSGLGLAIARTLVKLMHGDITVESQLGQGSTFVFSVRVLKVKDPKVEVDKYSCDEKARRILVVEDNIINQKVIRKLLEKIGCHVEIADNGAIGVQKYLTGHFDLVFMDLEMPEMNGLQALQQIKKAGANIVAPIIALTGHATSEQKEKCLQAGFDGFMSKPVQIQELQKLLQKYWH